VSGLLMLGTSRESSPLPEDEGMLGSRQHKPPWGRRTSRRIPDPFWTCRGRVTRVTSPVTRIPVGS